MSFFYRATEANVLKNGKIKLYLCCARRTTLCFSYKSEFWTLFCCASERLLIFNFAREGYASFLVYKKNLFPILLRESSNIFVLPATETIAIFLGYKTKSFCWHAVLESSNIYILQPTAGILLCYSRDNLNCILQCHARHFLLWEWVLILHFMLFSWCIRDIFFLFSWGRVPTFMCYKQQKALLFSWCIRYIVFLFSWGRVAIENIAIFLVYKIHLFPVLLRESSNFYVLPATESIAIFLVY